jgi:hypothetical protein
LTLTGKLASFTAWIILALSAVGKAEARVVTCTGAAKGIPIAQDFIRHPIGNPALPRFPAGVDLHDTSITVMMSLFVDRSGKVARWCVVRPNGQASSALELFTESAANAVGKWSYPKDFGLSGDLNVKHKLVQGLVIFRFAAPGHITVDATPISQSG